MSRTPGIETGLPQEVEEEFNTQLGESYPEIVARHAREAAVARLILETQLEHAA